MYNVFGMGELWGGGGGLIAQMCLCVYVYILVGCFPFNHNFWFEFLATSGSKWNSVLKISKKRTISCGVPKFSKISSLKFSSIHFCSGKFQSFWLNGLHFRNLTVLKLSGNFPRKFLYHLAPFPNL